MKSFIKIWLLVVAGLVAVTLLVMVLAYVLTKTPPLVGSGVLALVSTLYLAGVIWWVRK